MNRGLRNLTHVLLATAVTAAVIYAVVQLGGSALVPEVATAQSYVCPATGCTASSCHATAGGGSGGARRGHSHRDGAPGEG